MSAAPETVADGTAVFFHYVLKNDAGETLDSSEGGEPLATLQGADNIVPGLEKALAGRSKGESFEVTLSPEEGYGPVEGPGPQPLPRDAFPEDAAIEEGMQFMAGSEEEGYFALFVTRVEETQVWVDKNHPLAGATLHFSVTIDDVRAATKEELEHGHVHTPGHEHH